MIVLLAFSLRDALTLLGCWLVVGLVLGLTLGRFIRTTDRAARQLHNEQRRRSDGALDELAARRRRRSQR